MRPSIFKIYCPDKNRCLICNSQELNVNNLYTHTELAYYYYGTFHHHGFDFSKLIAEFDRVCFWTTSFDTIWVIKQFFPCLRIEKC